MYETGVVQENVLFCAAIFFVGSSEDSQWIFNVEASG